MAKAAKKKAAKKKAAKKATKKTAKKVSTGPAKPKTRVLAIDGGGILGITTAIYLRDLQTRLNKPLRDYFDIVAGTSTGSILAVAVSAGMDLTKIINLYKDRGDEIFSRGFWDGLGRTFTQGVSKPKYGDDDLADVLRDEMRNESGDEILFGSLPKLTLVTAYDTIAREPWVMKSDDEWLATVPAWELNKASSSAPTYFPAHIIELRGKRRSMIDGGVFANNPSACAAAEALSRGTAPSDLLLASFGNIGTTKRISARDAREWGVLEWAAPITSVLMDGAMDSAMYIARQMVGNKDWCFRFELHRGTAKHDMDDASRDHIKELMELAEEFIATPTVKKDLDKLAKVLK